jgi:hypothetical protein
MFTASNLFFVLFKTQIVEVSRILANILPLLATIIFAKEVSVALVISNCLLGKLINFPFNCKQDRPASVLAQILFSLSSTIVLT